jgi:hypothetical protein
VPAAAIMMDDEPFHWDILRSKVLVDMYNYYDPDKILFNHLEDRTATGKGQDVEGIDNYYSFVNCHEGLKILCGLTHHMKNITYANSSNLYNGSYAPTGEYQHGFPSMEARLSRARDTSLYYDIPYWYVPSADCAWLDFPEEAGCKRWKSPREVRANVNMSLTYGAKGIIYLGIYETPYAKANYDTLLDNHGNLREDDYGLVTYYKGNEDPELIEITYGYYIDPQLLYNEFVSLHTKLNTVRNTLQTLTSLDAFRYDDIPRNLVCDYVGNRDRGTQDDYPPDYEDSVDFLDFGTFVCPYTGVRYLAVSDRFCNRPPEIFPDPVNGESRG